MSWEPSRPHWFWEERVGASLPNFLPDVHVCTEWILEHISVSDDEIWDGRWKIPGMTNGEGVSRSHNNTPAALEMKGVGMEPERTTKSEGKFDFHFLF